jgi:Xaa-Pro aminopeptidase
MARPGITIDDLQKAAVEYLSSECVAKGFLKVKEDIAKYYFHNVSHFIGLDTHDPYLDPLGPDYKKVPLEAGMILSDEPGLYMADRSLGVRIEDDLLITDAGCQVLTSDIVKEIDALEARLASAHQ